MAHYPGVFVERPKQIHPPEANQIAAELERAALVISYHSRVLYQQRAILENAWSGNAKERFFDSFVGMPRRVDDLADELQVHAKQIRGITVTILERVLIQGPVPQ